MNTTAITYAIIDAKKEEITQAVRRISLALKSQEGLPLQDTASAEAIHDQLEEALRLLQKAQEAAEGDLFDQKVRVAEASQEKPLKLAKGRYLYKGWTMWYQDWNRYWELSKGQEKESIIYTKAEAVKLIDEIEAKRVRDEIERIR